MEIRYDVVEQEWTPLGRLDLRRFVAEGGEFGYEILIDGAFLMASHGSHSERAMARLAREWIPAERQEIAVLVGGLGAGHTLQEVLGLEGVSRVLVAEIGHRMVDWNRRYFAPFNGSAVDDPRVEVVVDDVARVVADHTEDFDMVLLDVDNGPGWLAAPDNAEIYCPKGLERCRQALREGGVLAIWSPSRNRALEGSLAEVFPGYEVVDTTSIGRELDEPGMIIYLAGSTPSNASA